MRFIGLIAYAAVLAVPAVALSQRSESSNVPITFNAQVGALLGEHCSACHHPGGPAPFSVLTYEDVKPWAGAIAQAVGRGAMPPWKPEHGFGGPFVNERRLTGDQVILLQRWVAQGAPRGDAMPPVAIAHAHGEWQLGTPDLIVTLPDPFILEPGGRDVFRNFAVPVPLSAGRFVKGVEFQPTNHRVTHHANIRVDPSGASARLESRDQAPGFEGITASSAVFPDGHFLGWTPGQVPPFLPPGLAWRLAPGSTMVVEMHLMPTRQREAVGFRVGLYFTETPPTRTPVMMRLGRQDIDIRPGAAAHVVRDEYTLPVDVEVQSVQPHAHYLAREVKGFATLPDGTRTWLIYIRDWDFHAQDLYRFAQPVPLPKGSVVHMEYTYDNSARNRRNPSSPPVRVRWGQYTSDEMGDLWLQVLTKDSRDTARLTQSIRAKERAEELVGYRVLLERDPSDPHVRASLAEALIFAGKRGEALEHLRAHVRLDPGSAVAHYNLATVLAASAQPDEALTEFRRALDLDPEDAAAYNGLGGVLLNGKGNAAAAFAAFQEAIRLDPEYANAYNNMGVALERLKRPNDALTAYLAAVELMPQAVDARYNAAGVLEAQRRYAEAARLYSEASDLAPDDRDARSRLARVRRLCGC